MFTISAIHEAVGSQFLGQSAFKVPFTTSIGFNAANAVITLVIPLSLPPAYVVRREVMFSQVCVCSFGGGGGVNPISIP